MWAAYDKYGPENFKCEVVETVNDDCTLKDLLAKEGYYIRTLKPQYNICQTPEKGGIPNKDRKLSEVWKQRIAEKSAPWCRIIHYGASGQCPCRLGINGQKPACHPGRLCTPRPSQCDC